MYISADGTGVPMRPEELEGREGKEADGKLVRGQQEHDQPGYGHPAAHGQQAGTVVPFAI